MTQPQTLRIAQVAPVAQSVPSRHAGSIETTTDLLVQALIARGHDVTLFATESSTTPARLHATFTHGYNEDSELWPWELCELLNVAAAIERAKQFDIIHCQAEYAPLAIAFQQLSETPLVHTVHHSPSPSEVKLWARHGNALFIAISQHQAKQLTNLDVRGVVHHAIDIKNFPFGSAPDDYLLFLGSFTPEKGVLEAIATAKHTNLRLILAAAENDYYREHIAPFVDGTHVTYCGEVTGQAKARLIGQARALLYPVQAAEPFGLVLAEAMTCGTPVAALRKGAVGELIDEGVTGRSYDTLEELISGLSSVITLNRKAVRTHAEQKFSIDRMVDQYLAIYSSVIKNHQTRPR
ncbi:MAG: glycosyltransferase family 4 protein [Acidobacteriota bacterium]|nr:glycosyltransferase family 4 protein [Acidobacteriota bacterium]